MNAEQLQDFKDKHGVLIKKGASDVFDDVSVLTPNPDQNDGVELVQPNGMVL